MEIIKERLKSTFLYEVYDFVRTKLTGLYFRVTSPQVVISKEFKRVFGRELNWDNPRDLNEKINWLKFHTNTQEWTDLSDKYKVREYVKRKGFEDILVPLYGKWNRVDEIDFQTLPNSFVLKTNHGSGDTIIVRDKNKINEKEVKKQLGKDLKHKFGYEHAEPHYLRIKPCIIAEKMLEQKNVSFSSSIIDYKFWCFDGKPKYVFVCYGRTKNGFYTEVHDLEWGYHPDKSVFSDHYMDGGGVVPKPRNLSKMIEVATVLSEGFPQVRVDLYDMDDKVYFGEMTFTSNGGCMAYFSQDFLKELGDYVVLPMNEEDNVGKN